MMSSLESSPRILILSLLLAAVAMIEQL